MDHPGVTCDVCNQTINGFRYKCLECEDYDLCQSCESDYHSGHILCRFADPITQPDKEFLKCISQRCPRDKPFLIQGFHDHEKCNICGIEYVVGYLYKCVDCSNFNACRRCEKKENSKCVDGQTHLLFRFADPLSLNSFNKRFWKEILEIRSIMRSLHGEQELSSVLSSGSTKHEGVKCDVCNSEVSGLRFKCIDCVDFDLCSYCEPKTVHTGHLLIRFGKRFESETKTFFEKIMQLRSSNQSHRLAGERSSNYNSRTMMHCGYSCDNCESTIHGFRYKCLECSGFDLCSFCQKKGCHTEHLMIRFTEPPSQNIVNESFADAIIKLNRPTESVPLQELSRTMCRTNVMGGNGEHSYNNAAQFTSNFNKNPQGRSIQNCTICFVMPSEMILLDCGHLCMCSNCIVGYMKSSQQCPICRVPIKSTHRAYY